MIYRWEVLSLVKTILS